MVATLEDWVQAARDLRQRDGALDLIPGRPGARDWGPATLDRLEAALLREYATHSDVPNPVRREIQLFLGNGLIEHFDGRWVDLSEFGVGDEVNEPFGVAYPGLEHVDVCSGMVSVPFVLRSGHHWSSLFATNQVLLSS